MGYQETHCQLCGIGFAIARIRHAGEPKQAAWDYPGGRENFPDESCGEGSGCNMIGAKHWREHIAGPGCVSIRGYNGHRITVEEMKGSRAVQALLIERPLWIPEPDDQEFEIEGKYFLTGIGDGSPDGTEYLENSEPVRHGLEKVFISNMLCGVCWFETLCCVNLES